MVKCGFVNLFGADLVFDLVDTGVQQMICIYLLGVSRITALIKRSGVRKKIIHRVSRARVSEKFVVIAGRCPLISSEISSVECLVDNTGLTTH